MFTSLSGRLGMGSRENLDHVHLYDERIKRGPRVRCKAAEGFQFEGSFVGLIEAGGMVKGCSNSEKRYTTSLTIYNRDWSQCIKLRLTNDGWVFCDDPIHDRDYTVVQSEEEIFEELLTTLDAHGISREGFEKSMRETLHRYLEKRA